MFAAPGPFWAAYDTVLKSSTHEDGYGFGFIGFNALSQIFFAIGKLIPGATPWYFSNTSLFFTLQDRLFEQCVVASHAIM